MLTNNQTSETATTMAAKASPPVAVVSAHLAGMSIADWVQYATFVYVLLMIGQKCWHLWKEWKTGKDPEGAA